jgi:hypothetical protein
MFDLKRHKMHRNDSQKGEARGPERGSVIVFVVIALVALIGFAGLATETGRTWQVRTQLQAIADTASLGGVGNLLLNDFTTVDQAGAKAAAAALGPAHSVLGDPVGIRAVDVRAGSWDLATRTFTNLPGSTDPDLVRAVQVVTRRDGNINGPMPTIFGAAVGLASIRVNAQSVAYWGWAGGGGPGVADLPIAIDCCAVSGNTPGSACTENYCTTIANTIHNPCPLSGGGATVSCLEFSSQGDQNACWTAFDGDSSAIGTPTLLDLIEDGNSTDISGEVYVDNGDKVPAIREIYDRFHGTGSYSPPPGEGDDTDVDDVADSWVVTLPVIECQNPGDGCATGNTQEIKGFICFEIKEVLVPPHDPARIIKGNFLCPTDSRCDTTGLGPGGSVPGTISAQYPVIVD